jgi:hypothetical protein
MTLIEIHIKDGNIQHPFMIMRMPNLLSREFWVDKKMRGRNFEYYRNQELLEQKYPKICDIFR